MILFKGLGVARTRSSPATHTVPMGPLKTQSWGTSHVCVGCLQMALAVTFSDTVSWSRFLSLTPSVLFIIFIVIYICHLGQLADVWKLLCCLPATFGNPVIQKCFFMPRIHFIWFKFVLLRFIFVFVCFAFFHIEAPPKIAPLSARRPIVLAPEAVALASRETSKFVKPEVTFSIFYKSLFQTSKRHAIDKSDNSLDLIVEVALRWHCDVTLRWNTAMNVRLDNGQLLENKYCFGFVSLDPLKLHAPKYPNVYNVV